MAEGVGSCGSEDRVISSVAGSGGSAENGKLDISSVLKTSGSSNLLSLVENGSSDNWDGIRRGSVVTSHLSMELTDGSVKWDISVFLVHVVVSGSWLISQDNAKSFDMIGSSFEDLINWQNLTLCRLGLELVAQMVPEFGFSNDFISCEETNGKDFWVGLLLSGKLASEYEILSNLKIN